MTSPTVSALSSWLISLAAFGLVFGNDGWASMGSGMNPSFETEDPRLGFTVLFLDLSAVSGRLWPAEARS